MIDSRLTLPTIGKALGMLLAQKELAPNFHGGKEQRKNDPS
jgi:hypothetical protein